MTLRMTTFAAGAALAFFACSGPAEDGRNPFGSQAMVTSQDFSALYVAVSDDGTVARIDAASLDVTRVEVGGEPTRVARVEDRVLVTLRAERAIVELRDEGGTLTELRRVEVGAEPYGIVATEDGARVYVAVSQSGRVVELDGATLAERRAWYTPNEPRWLALHPSGGTLYVAGMGIDGIATIDLDTGSSNVFPFPERPGFGTTGFMIELTGRVTGDLAASPDGKRIAIPMLYVDNTSAIVETEDAPVPSSGGYGGRLNPTVVLVPTDDDGTMRPDDTEIVIPSAIFGEPVGYPSSVTFSPDGEHVFATSENSSRTVVFPAEPPEEQAAPTFGPGVDVWPTRPAGAVLKSPAGARAVAFTEGDRGFVFGFLDRRATSFRIGNIDDLATGVAGEPSRRWTESHVSGIATTTLPLEVEEGRRLFYSADDSLVSGGGVSCSTCHFDGRTDGLTWTFERSKRQTPSLAGMVSLREPVRWRADRPTVADDVLSTSQGLMGGSGMTMEDAQRIAAFVDYTRAVDLPMRGETNAQIELGREIFHRPEVGCATCHSGAIYSDKKTYDMFGLDGVKTPSLLGVAATAPYLHDGSAPNLMSVLVRSRAGTMGDTSSLDDEEMAALEAFLRTL